MAVQITAAAQDALQGPGGMGEQMVHMLGIRMDPTRNHILGGEAVNIMAVQSMIDKIRTGQGMSSQAHDTLITALNNPAERAPILERYIEAVRQNHDLVQKFDGDPSQLLSLREAGAPPIVVSPQASAPAGSTPAAATPGYSILASAPVMAAAPPAPIPLSADAQSKLLYFGLQDVPRLTEPSGVPFNAFMIMESKLRGDIGMDPVVRNAIVQRLNENPDAALRALKAQIAEHPQLIDQGNHSSERMLELFGMPPTFAVTAPTTGPAKADQYMNRYIDGPMDHALNDGLTQGLGGLAHRYIGGPVDETAYKNELRQAILRFEAIQPTIEMATKTLALDHADPAQMTAFNDKVAQLRNTGVTDERELAVQGYMAASAGRDGRSVTPEAAANAIRRDEYKLEHGGLTPDQSGKMRFGTPLPARDLGLLDRAIDLDYLTGADPRVPRSVTQTPYIPLPWRDGIDHHPAPVAIVMPDPHANVVRTPPTAAPGGSPPATAPSQPQPSGQIPPRQPVSPVTPAPAAIAPAQPAAAPSASPQQRANYFAGRVASDDRMGTLTAEQRDAYRNQLRTAVAGLENTQITPDKVAAFLHEDGKRPDLIQVYNDKRAELERATPNPTPQQQHDIALQSYQAMYEKQNGTQSPFPAENMDLYLRSRIYSQEDGRITPEQRAAIATQLHRNPDDLKSVSMLDYLTTAGAPAGTRVPNYGGVRADVAQKAIAPSSAATAPVAPVPPSQAPATVPQAPLPPPQQRSDTSSPAQAAAPQTASAAPATPAPGIMATVTAALSALSPISSAQAAEVPRAPAALSNPSTAPGGSPAATVTPPASAATPAPASPPEVNGAPAPLVSLLLGGAETLGLIGHGTAQQVGTFIHGLNGLEGAMPAAQAAPGAAAQPGAQSETAAALKNDVLALAVKLMDDPSVKRMIEYAKTDSNYNDMVKGMVGIDLANPLNTLHDMDTETTEQLAAKKAALQKLVDNPDELKFVADRPMLLSSLSEIKHGFSGVMSGNMASFGEVMQGLLGMLKNIHSLGDIGTMFKMLPDMMSTMGNDWSGTPGTQRSASNNGGALTAQLDGLLGAPGSRTTTDAQGRTIVPQTPQVPAAPQGDSRPSTPQLSQ